MFKNKILGTQIIVLLLVVFGFSGTTMASSPVLTMPDFTVLAKNSSPVVVNISTTKLVGKSRVQDQFRGMPDDMLRYFFGLPKGADPRSQAPKHQVSSLGSGFVISVDGYIVTNYHVVEGAEDIIVRMSNRREYKAKIIGLDKRTDVALLKIDAQNLPVAKIGSSKNLQVGQWVLAIGSPFGLDYTVTHGIVSALGRSLPDDTYVPFVQTDVPINPGNSGGPLFNLSGEVVGVNSQIYSKGGGSVGLSFSIPIDIAMNVVNQLKVSGKVERGFLGVSVQEVPADLAKSFGLKEPKGALVAEVVKDSPAAKHGIKVGDIIIEFDGKQLNRSAELPPIVGVTPLNRKVKVKILRQGKVKTLKVKLTSLAKVVSSAQGFSEETILGVQVNPVEPEILASLNLPFGVSVASVTQDGVAQKSGIRAGDILVTVNFQTVKSVKELRKIAKNLPKNRAVPVRIVRNKRSIFLPLNLGNSKHE